MPKVVEWSGKIKDFEERMRILSAEEVMLFGFKSNYNFFTMARDFFTPYRNFWTAASEFLISKRAWFEHTRLLDLNCDEVHTAFKQTVDAIQHFQESTLIASGKEKKSHKVVN
jgi:hypothetical protein